MGDAALDPGALRGRGRHAHRRPRPARRGLGRRHRQGARPRRRRRDRRRRPRGVRPRVRAAGDQGERPLRRRLPAVHRARPAADRQARGRARARDAAATRSPTAAPARATTRSGSRRRSRRWRPSSGCIAPVREWQMGREEEIAYAREHGIPVKGGTEAAAVLDRRQPLGPLLGGRRDRGPRRRRPRDDVFQLVTRARGRPRRAAAAAGRLRGGLPGLARRRAPRPGRADRARRPRSAARHGVGIVDHIEDRIVGLKVRDLYEVPAAAILLDGPPRPREARLDDPPERVQARPRPQVGLPLLRGPLARAAARRPRRLHGLAPTSTSPARSP